MSTPMSWNVSQADSQAADRGAGIIERIFLIAVMAVGSIMLWLGWPLGLIYIVSKAVDSTQPTMGPYLVLLFGIPVGMVLIGRFLGFMDRHYNSRTKTNVTRYRAVWLRSLRAEAQRDSKWRVLDVVMLWSVSMAGLFMAVWFFLFAGSSI
jgi:hypothetical protein